MKKFIVGLVSGLMIASSMTVIASSGRNITVFDNVKRIVVDKVEKTFDKNNVPFVYNGGTYVPLRFVADALGEQVSWDGKTGTVFIGETDNKDADHWGEDIKHMSVKDKRGYKHSYSYDVKGKTAKTNTGDTYSNYFTNEISCSSIKSDPSYQLIEFPLNGNYKQFTSVMGCTDRYKSSKAIVDVNIYLDDKKVQTFTMSNGEMPRDIKINTVGANKIGFEVIQNEKNNSYHYIEIGFFDGQFIK